MQIHYGPREVLQIDDAQIMFKNFEGRESMYNRKGDRNFSIRINDAVIADELAERGWNVKIKPGRDEDDGPFMRLDVKVKYTQRDDGSVNGPTAYLWTGNRRNELDEESIGCLDQIEIETVNMDIRPYDWEINGRRGRSAYLKSIEVYQKIDRFAARYANMEEESKLPF